MRARHPSARWAIDLGAASVTLAAVLGALASALVLRTVTGFSVQNVVVAVVLTLTLSRTAAPSGRLRLVGAVELPIVAVAASGAGWLVEHEPWLGQPLFVVALCVGILARRYGPTIRQLGRLTALPFLGLLIVPAVPAAGGEASSILWAPVVAMMAIAWSTVGDLIKIRLITSRPPELHQSSPVRRRWDAPIRMAIQMAAGLGAAFVAGQLLFGDRWSWTVLSAYLVASGNRGRGDVVHKAALRVLGAGVGTVGATLGAAHLQVGNRWLLVALFAIMGISLALRERNYAFWAAGVTAMVALLHGYYGDGGPGALQDRLGGVLIGSVLGVLAAWFVRPIRTADVTRRRIADCLAALTDDLGDDAGAPRTTATLVRLDEIAPTLRAHYRTVGRRHSAPPYSAVIALHALTAQAALAIESERRLLRRDVVRVRRAIVGKDNPQVHELPPPLATIHAVLEATRRTSGQPAGPSGSSG